MKSNNPRDDDRAIANIILVSISLILFIGLITAFVDSFAVRIAGVILQLGIGVFMAYTMIKFKK